MREVDAAIEGGATMFSLRGRVALVTGASRGLGLAIAQGLAEAGAMLAINAVNSVMRRFPDRSLLDDCHHL